METMLGSLRCFGKLKKQCSSLLFSEEEYYMIMKEVMKENLGIVDISVVNYD